MKSFYLLFLAFLAIASVHAEEKADHVIVEKSQHLLSLYKSDHLLASYHVVFGSNPNGTKQKQNDGKTPEGSYILDTKKADSRFHKAFHISYPNEKDLANAKRLGVDAGGDIMIHGQKNGFSWASPIMQKINWTKGCIALSNHDIDAIWDKIDVGTPIEIKP
ncbi:MAG: L,D-transpeptidase family protein [Gammaproteobacteria bacterium]|nr:L,D-transpeptidase family protein [Gammaproteobacteria bacterium]